MINNILNHLNNKINKFFKHNKKNKVHRFFDRELNLLIENNMIEFKDNYILFKNNCCPSCGCILDNQTTKTKKYPHCKEKIIVRTNRVNKEKLLLNEKQLKQYDKFENQLKEISFCEKHISVINNMHANYMYKFYLLKSEKKDLSVRDHTFSFENWLYVELDRKAYNEYMKGIKLNFQDKVLKCDEAIWEFKSASNIFRFMIELTKFKEKEDIALEMILSLLYRNVNIAHLPYYHWKDRTFDKIQFYSDINDGGMYLLKDYIEKHNINIKDLKSNFILLAHSFIINIVEKEKAWLLIVDAYYKYLELIKTNNFSVYKK